MTAHPSQRMKEPIGQTVVTFELDSSESQRPRRLLPSIRNNRADPGSFRAQAKA
jgi:hypothetical protein